MNVVYAFRYLERRPEIFFVDYRRRTTYISMNPNQLKGQFGVDPKFNTVANLLSFVYFEDDNCEVVVSREWEDRLLFSIRWAYEKIPNRTTFGGSWHSLKRQLSLSEDFVVIGDYFHTKRFLETTTTVTEFEDETDHLDDITNGDFYFDELSRRSQRFVRNERGLSKVLSQIDDKNTPDRRIIINGRSETSSTSSVHERYIEKVERLLKTAHTATYSSSLITTSKYGKHFLFKIDWVHSRLEYDSSTRPPFSVSALKDALQAKSQFYLQDDHVHLKGFVCTQPTIDEVQRAVDRYLDGTHLRRNRHIEDVHQGLLPNIKRAVRGPQSLITILKCLHYTISEDNVVDRQPNRSHPVSPTQNEHCRDEQGGDNENEEEIEAQIAELLESSTYTKENYKLVLFKGKSLPFFQLDWIFEKLQMNQSSSSPFESKEELLDFLKQRENFLVFDDNCIQLASVAGLPSEKAVISEVKRVLECISNNSTTVAINEVMNQLPNWAKKRFRHVEDLHSFIALHDLSIPGKLDDADTGEDLAQALKTFQQKIGNDDMVLELLTTLSKSNLTTFGLRDLIDTIKANYVPDDAVPSESGDASSIDEQIVNKAKFEMEALKEYYALQPDKDQDCSDSQIANLDELE